MPDSCDYSDKYDTDEFISGDLCCTCGGGEIDAPASDPSPPASTCKNLDTLGYVDSYGDSCDDYVNFPEYCHTFDTVNFISGDLCCACGGGNKSKPSPSPQEPGLSLPASTCTNLNTSG